MSAQTRYVPRAAIVASLIAASMSLAAPAAMAQEGDLCGVLTPEDLAAAIPGSYGSGNGFSGTCQWDGTTDAGTGVIVIVYSAPGAVADMPGAEVIDIGGRAAFSMTDPAMTVPTQAVGVESATGPMLLMTVGTDDDSVDLPAAAVALATVAVERFESGAGTAAATSAPGASAAATTSDGLCSLATPEEVAAAAGLDVGLTLSEFDGTCSYESVTDTGYVLIYIAQQDPAIFDALISSLGAVEVDGPGDTDWWAGSLGSLFSRTGDQVLQVSYSSRAAPSEEELQQTVIAIMDALLDQ